MTTAELDRHFQGILTFSHDYIRENLTTGNLMELTVYLANLMEPHECRIQDMLQDEKRDNPYLIGEDEQLMYENCKHKYLDFHEEYSQQYWVYGRIFSALHPYTGPKTEPIFTLPGSEQEPTKTAELTGYLFKYGFFDLPKVKTLSDNGKQELITLLCENKLPYIIAMFDFLGFLGYLKKEYFFSAQDLHKAISKWLGSDFDGRAVKGNIAVLDDYSEDNRGRYTAHKHKKKVSNDYQTLQ